MKVFVLSLALLLAAPVQADELADGINAWEAQDFTRAHQLLGKLAAAGNAEAQLMVGEMFGFGEGVPEDFTLAEVWLSKAKAAGHKDAADSLLTMQERRMRKKDIAYYVSSYKGEEVRLESYQCVAPVFPANSLSKAQIKEVQAQMDAWMVCYQAFSKGLQEALPAGKRIPLDVAKLMSLGELQQARATMDKAYAQVDADARQQGSAVLAAHEAWYGRVDADQKKRQLDIEQQKKLLGDVNQQYRELMTTPSAIYLPNGARGSRR
ncbi:sel1 repeat family protein [Pseudoduganella violaceinigra]|uniref:sel1 repeat family protein n=1 Tax=Pseudoduganella violaceinigra TaxID=246602 RepID=UPI000411197B|nr:sel1 repeat family protein [Pseudoduganella violaceinigra]